MRNSAEAFCSSRRAIWADPRKVSELGYTQGFIKFRAEPHPGPVRDHFAAQGCTLPVVVPARSFDPAEKRPGVAVVGVFGEHVVVKSEPALGGGVIAGIAGHENLVRKRAVKGINDPALGGRLRIESRAGICVPLAPESEQAELHEGNARVVVISLAHRGDEALHRGDHARIVVIGREAAAVVVVTSELYSVLEPVRQTGRLGRIVDVDAQHDVFASGCGNGPSGTFPFFKREVALLRLECFPPGVEKDHRVRQLDWVGVSIGTPTLEWIGERAGCRLRTDHNLCDCGAPGESRRHCECHDCQRLDSHSRFAQLE